MTNLELQKMAVEVRKGIIEGVHSAKAGHPGGSLSAADIFTYLYFEEMNVDPKDPKNEERDRFVLSKGHTAPGLYSVLAHKGYFPLIESIRYGIPCLYQIISFLLNSAFSLEVYSDYPFCLSIRFSQLTGCILTFPLFFETRIYPS